MKNKPRGLSNFQITAIVTHSIIGLAIMFLPRRAAHSAGIDGAFVTFAAGVFSLFFVAAIVILSRRFPHKTVIEYAQDILGKYIGWAYGALIALYTLATASFVLRGFADAMKVLLLPRTPLEIIMICMLLVSIYCVHGGVATIARVCEIFILPVIAVICVLILFNFPDVQLFRYRESFSNGIKPIILGIPNIMLAYQGYEVLFFLMPFMNNRKKALQAGTAGLAFPILIYTGLVFITIGIIGASPTAELVYPTIHVARRIGLNFVERFDIFFIVFWILAVFTTIVIYLYMASLSITRLFWMRNYKPFIFILAPVCYAIAILPQNISQINVFGNIINYLGVVMVSSSIPLLILSLIRKKGGSNNG